MPGSSSVPVCVQKGQDVLIYADLDQPEFVQMVVEEAYKAKARKVTVNWNYQPLQKLHVRYQSVKTLGTVEAWEEARLQHYVDILPCRIHLISEDPDGLKGVNLEKMAKGRQAVYQVVNPMPISGRIRSSGALPLSLAPLGPKRCSRI